MKPLQLAAHTLRGLAMDAVQKAASGHPGMPMGMADVAAVLFLKHLNHCPARPDWPNRDRFVLSAGHGSMLLYGLLHLAGYDLRLDDLRAFRQWGSRTPGHPEYRHTPGVETTTGPLGQGCGNAVGMALAERMLAARFNVGTFAPVDHATYVIASDGDLMEGVSHEAFALAGHLGLHKLVVFYDSNRITIEGSTDLAYSDDVRQRFLGYHWNVLEIDGHDAEAIDRALEASRAEKERPTLIITRTHIAHGAPTLHDTAKAHGEPLGPDEVRAAKRNLGLPEDSEFHVPDAVRALFAARARELEARAAAWDADFRQYAAAHPDRAEQWRAFHAQELPADLADHLPAFDPAKPVATRAAGGKVMQEIARRVPWLVGGAADLAPSTRTSLEGFPDVARHAFAGRNLHFGVREHGMAAILNGMALHGGFRVFGATFYIFSDYCRPSVRLAALMGLPVIYVFTHDSFYVGEDGPTHEPVEHTASFRAMPNVVILRPADATETAAAWLTALGHRTGPTLLLLTRQNVPVIDRTVCAPAQRLERGAYTLWQSAAGTPAVVLIASGSEVGLALEAARVVAREGVVRVVSMPSWELFARQTEAYRREVIPDGPAKLAIEAGSGLGWERFVGPRGRVLSLERFGASAPYPVMAERFGFTPANVVRIVREMVAAG
jgi:transketolase